MTDQRCGVSRSNASHETGSKPRCPQAVHANGEALARRQVDANTRVGAGPVRQPMESTTTKDGGVRESYAENVGLGRHVIGGTAARNSYLGEREVKAPSLGT